MGFVVSVMLPGMTYLAENDLWREVLRRAAQRPGPAFDALGEPKVRHLRRDEHVSSWSVGGLQGGHRVR